MLPQGLMGRGYRAEGRGVRDHCNRTKANKLNKQMKTNGLWDGSVVEHMPIMPKALDSIP